MKKTVLYEKHLEYGGKMVPFAGYTMPVQYKTGVIAEHMAVRQAAGLFDVSHMGELLLTGPDALAALQILLTNDMDGMQDGDCRYSPMCNEQGGVVDDLIVYKKSSGVYWLVVNAANREKDANWIQSYLSAFSQVEMQDCSEITAELAIQGPNCLNILSKLSDIISLPEKYYTFVEDVKVAEIPCLVSRTGYTGEDGFELYCESQEAPALWDALLEAGKEQGLIPCGLGARDTLRLEAGMPLYGHEMNDQISPVEAGLGFFVKMEKPNFIGKQALEKAGSPARRRTGIKMTGRGIARENCEVFHNDVSIGTVTSGTQLPFLGYAGAMALLDVAYREPGTEIEVDVRGRRVAAEVVKLPFYKRDKK